MVKKNIYQGIFIKFHEDHTNKNKLHCFRDILNDDDDDGKLVA